ncbi:MAG: TRAP transporter small permease [Bacilli bacterium]|jgi:TRAP-type C4-dicarboxylate transport system permease small subunit
MGNLKKKLKYLIVNIDDVISCVAMSLTVIFVVSNVIARYLFKETIMWAEELTMFAFAWVIFVGAASTYKSKMHVGIDLVVDLLPIKIRRPVELGVLIFMVLLLGYLAVLSFSHMYYSRVSTSLMMRLSFAWKTVAAPIGFFIMFIYSIRDVQKFFTTKGVQKC